MSQKHRQPNLDPIRRRYKKSNRKRKKLILDELCLLLFKYNRKYLIRLLRHAWLKPKQQQKPGRKMAYQVDMLLPVLQTIWLATRKMCSKKLKASLPEWLPHYEQTYGELDDSIRGQLLSLSAATIDRYLKPTRLLHPGKRLCTTKPGRILKKQVQIRTGYWDVKQPGFMEADTVAHCGSSLMHSS